MSTSIAWTDETCNPIRGIGSNRWICQKVSPGCDHCYSERLNTRWGGQPFLGAGKPLDLVDANLIRLDLKAFDKIRRLKKPSRVFVCDMTDLFGEWVREDWLDAIFAIMALTPQHTFQLLTKRPKRMRDYVAGTDFTIGSREEMVSGHAEAIGKIVWDSRGSDPANYGLGNRARERLANRRPWPGWPLPNVWLGVSVESQEYAWRLNYLAETPAAVRFVSAEPLLGPLDIYRWLDPPMHPVYGKSLDDPHVDWVIVGGESGPGYRPMDLEWARDLKDQCDAAGVRFFFKQAGGPRPGMGEDALGGIFQAFPEAQ